MRARTVSKITGIEIHPVGGLSRSNIPPLFKFDSSSIEENAVGERWTRLLLSDDKCETFSKGGDWWDGYVDSKRIDLFPDVRVNKISIRREEKKILRFNERDVIYF